MNRPDSIRTIGSGDGFDSGKESTMNMVFSSENYWVLAYPAEHGIELVDKTGGRSLFIQGAAAERFSDSMTEIVIDNGADSEEVDEYLDEYCAGYATPFVFH